MSTDALTGLVPAAIHARHRTLTLIAAGSAWFNEPFYRLTIDRLLASPATRTRHLSFAELHDELGGAATAPGGVVLHTSRCGSTLLTKMLRHDRSRLALSEPSPIGAATRLHLHAPGDAETDALITDLFTLIERYAVGRGQRSVLKLSSWQTLTTTELAGRLPTTPFVFVHRPATEVVASLMAHPPSWAPARFGGPGSRADDGLSNGTLPAVVLDTIDPSLEAAGFYASVWAALVRAALSGPTDRMLFVDLRELQSSPVAVLERVATHLSLDDGFDPVRAAGEVRYYAKSADPTQPFDPAGRHRRPELTDRDEDEVAAIVDDLPYRLRARAGPSSPTGSSGPTLDPIELARRG